MCIVIDNMYKPESELAAMAVAKGVAKVVLYLNAWWRWHPAVAIAVATHSVTA